MIDPRSIDHVKTISGLYVNPLNADPDTIIIEDIAYALSMQCRWGGHSNTFYSVAEHCVSCAQVAPNKHMLAALMHDAAEAYLVDVTRPVKKELSEYKVIEDKLMKVIAKKFGFQYPLHEIVTKIDDEMAEMEHDLLMVPNTKNFRGWDIPYAKKRFLETFKLANQL